MNKTATTEYFKLASQSELALVIIVAILFWLLDYFIMGLKGLCYIMQKNLSLDASLMDHMESCPVFEWWIISDVCILFIT